MIYEVMKIVGWINLGLVLGFFLAGLFAANSK
jgi:hypothetical protein